MAQRFEVTRRKQVSTAAQLGTHQYTGWVVNDIYALLHLRRLAPPRVCTIPYPDGLHSQGLHPPPLPRRLASCPAQTVCTLPYPGLALAFRPLEHVGGGGQHLDGPLLRRS